MKPTSTRQRKFAATKHYMVASDFDKTLSFNDSGYVLSDMLGIADFEERVEALSARNLVQPGGELTYLLLHDPDYKQVRHEHLVETGKRIHLKDNIPLLCRILADGIEDRRFSFYVISAAPQEVIQSALDGIVPHGNIFGTRLSYDNQGAISGLVRLPAGYGKVAVLNQLLASLQISDERVIYSGDGSSDIHVMLHINQRRGFTIAVSQAEYITQIAKRTVLSDSALSVLIPVLEELCGWDQTKIRTFFESNEILIQEWAKMRTDTLTMRQAHEGLGAAEAPARPNA